MKRVVTITLVLTVILTLALAVACQAKPELSVEFGNMLSTQGNYKTPLSFPLKYMQGSWWHFYLGDQNKPLTLQEAEALAFGDKKPQQDEEDWISRLFLGQINDFGYLTQGYSLTVGETCFLIVYAPEPIDLESYQKQIEKASIPPKPARLTPDTIMKIGFIDLAKTLPEMKNLESAKATALIEASEATTQQIEDSVFKQASEKAQAAVSLSNLKQLALALLMWAEDHNEKLPDMPTAEKIKATLLPYAKDEDIFASPFNGKPYKYNNSLAGKGVGQPEIPWQTVTFYEDSPDSYELRGVAYLDGHAKRVKESDWHNIQQQSGMIK